MKITEGYMPYLGYKTYYRIAGECSGNKKPLILLHGGPGSTHNYFEVLDQLADEGRAIISYDQLGCGNSYVEGHSELWCSETWMNELIELRKYLGLDEIHLLGQSWGGMLSIEYLCDHKPEGIKSVILSSTHPSAKLWAQEQHRMIKFMSQEDQDAIAKGMAYRKEHNEHRWTCPYIPVDPHDIGRTYDADVIRINSQSGKGGIGFVLEQNYGYNLPPKMREALGYKVKSVSDHSHKELSATEVLHIFEDTFLNRRKPLNVIEAHFAQVNGITATVTLDLNGQRKVVTSVGNGRLDAVANAIQSATGMEFHLENYSEHSLDEGSTSRAASYVGLTWGDGTVTWGAGTDTDIIVAGVKALVSAINNK